MRINRGILILSIVMIVAGGGTFACNPLPRQIGDKGANKPAINVAAASDLKPALDKIKANYEAESGQKVDVTYGSSGLLARQVEQGAPIDIFISASTVYIDELENKNLLRGRDRMTLAYGRLALIFGGETKGKNLNDLVGGSVERIAIANPQHAPYGAAARDALTNVKLWDRVENKMVYGDNVAQAFQYLSSGDVNAAIVALSHAIDNDIKYAVVDERLHRPLAVTLAVVSRDSGDVAPFLSYLKSEDARQVLLDYGYKVPNAKLK